MSFTFSEKHITDFHTLGYTVFQSILPPSLIRDLRRACDKGRDLARAEQGPQVQRFQPVNKYAIDQKPFRDYAELPPLQDAVKRLLSPRHIYGDPALMGVLLEPAEHPWCTAWHRDWRDHMPPEVFEDEFRAEWDQHVVDMDFLNQINCPLYDDNCTWFVPGSHYRQQNTPGEIAAAAAITVVNEAKSDEEKERLCLEYCQGMPGAVQLVLKAGDFAIYRPCAWHLGNYVPYSKRATLHDAPVTPRWRAHIAERDTRRDAAMKRWKAKQSGSPVPA